MQVVSEIFYNFELNNIVTLLNTKHFEFRDDTVDVSVRSVSLQPANFMLGALTRTSQSHIFFLLNMVICFRN